MKSRRFIVFTFTLLVLLLGTTCLADSVDSPGQIYLYGEAHGVDKIMDKEFELWFDYYHNENMRHLFMEKSYYTAEFLNLWMRADNDDILDTVYNDWKGSPAYNPSYKEFFKRIKRECPETIFHGTDVGHQFDSTGVRFLTYLEMNGLKGTEQYLLTQEAIEQGRTFYRRDDFVYREQMMVANFIREFDALSGENIMGIYGSAHTGLDDLDFTRSVPCMATQLKERYGDAIYSEDLSWLQKDIEQYRIDTITVRGKDYVAHYFGQEDISWFAKQYRYRDFWRLENAYDDFKDEPKINNVLPYNNYPMLIEQGQIFVIDYTKRDGLVERKYYRSDGLIWNDYPSTEEFVVN